MPRFSLTTRLTALFCLSSTCVLLGLALLIFAAMDRHFAEEDYVMLGDNLRMIGKTMDTVPAGALPARLSDSYQHHGGLLTYVQGGDAQTLYSTPGFDFRPALAALAQLPADQERFQWEQDGKDYRGMRRSIPTDGGQGRPISVVVGMDTEIHSHFLRGFRHSLVFYVALAALASGMLGWWAARSGLSPLRTMASHARGVTGNKLSERMPVDAVPVEMADLAANLNAMLARLQDDFRRLSEFSSDLAHELRTPITNLMTQTQVVLSQPRDAEKYREVLASNAEELQRLARMVSDMLYLAKMEHGLDLPDAEAIRIADEVHALFEFYDALAEDKSVQLQLHGDGRVTGDRLMLRRALNNLLSNAMRHTPPGGKIVVDIASRDGGVEVAVENDGAEIPAEIQPSLFDRFFRADKSRARPESDSVGLGLSITKAIMTAHGGTIAVQSTRGKTRFTLRFPVASA